MIVAMIPVATSILCGDQPMTKEGSMNFMIMGMPWDVNPGVMTIAVVASIKITVVIPNMNICPGELNKDPLELESAMST